MKRAVKLLILLYPAKWRKRYGEEIEALMEDAKPGLRSMFDLFMGAIRAQMRRLTFLKLAGAMALLGAIAGFAASFLFSPRYRATGVLEIRVAGDPAALAHADWRLSEYVVQIKSRVTSRQSLIAIITDPRLSLYESERASMPLEDAMQQMRDDLKISVAPPVLAHSRSAVVSFEFTYRDAAKAASALNEAISRIIETPVNWEEDRQPPPDSGANARIAALQERIDSLEKRLGIVRVGAATPAAGRIRAHIDATVLDPPRVPSSPVSPRRDFFAGIGTGAGLGLGLAIGLIRRRLPPVLPVEEV